VLNQSDPSLDTKDSVVGVLLGNGDGTFQNAVVYSSGAYDPISLAVADVNLDGKLDILVLNARPSASKASPSMVSVLLGNGNGTFQSAVLHSLGTGIEAAGENGSLAVADVNGDGKPDLVVATCASENCSGVGSVTILLGKGNDTFEKPVSYETGEANAASVVVADVNGDGIQDLLISDYCATSACDEGALTVMLGAGEGNFQKPVSYSSGSFYNGQIVLADVNSNGIPDVIMTGCGAGDRGTRECDTTESHISVFTGKGNGTFGTAVTFLSGGDVAESVAAADLTGNGKPDLVVANCLTDVGGTCGLSNSGNVSVLLNTNTVSRTASTTTLASSPNPSTAGHAVTFSAIVVSTASETPAGTVSFFYGTTNLGDAVVNASGVATFTISTLPVGTDDMTAVYNGDTKIAPSTSLVLPQVVVQAGSPIR
jgi:hypothetical protein